MPPPQPGRPPSSSHRPGTASASARPTTSQGGHGGQQYQAGAQFQGGLGQGGVGQGGQYQQYEIEEEYEDEESEDEDVFAFLPPTTADADAEREQASALGPNTSLNGLGGGAGAGLGQGAGGQGQQGQQGQLPPMVSAAQAAASLQAQYYPSSASASSSLAQHQNQNQNQNRDQNQSPFAFAPNPTTNANANANANANVVTSQQRSYSYAPPTYPTPTFDPWGRYQPPAPSTPLSPATPAHAPSSASAGGGGFASNNPYFAQAVSGVGVGPPPASPSTDSHSQPSTGYGYSHGGGGSRGGYGGGYGGGGQAGQEQFRLRRMGTGNTGGEHLESEHGESVEGESQRQSRRQSGQGSEGGHGGFVVQGEPEGQGREEVHGQEVEETMRGGTGGGGGGVPVVRTKSKTSRRKEVRVSLPGSGHPQRASGDRDRQRDRREQEDEDEDEDDEDDDDDDDDDISIDKEILSGTTAADGEIEMDLKSHAHANINIDLEAGAGDKDNKKSTSKTKSTSTSTSKTKTKSGKRTKRHSSRMGMGTAGSMAAGAGASGVQPHPQGAGGVGGLRSRNPNAQPYYAYAQYASAYGYPTPGGAGAGGHGHGHGRGPGTAHTTGTSLSHRTGRTSRHGGGGRPGTGTGTGYIPDTPTTETYGPSYGYGSGGGFGAGGGGGGAHRRSHSQRSGTSSYIATTKRHPDDESIDIDAESLSLEGGYGGGGRRRRRRVYEGEEDGEGSEVGSEGSIKMEFDFDAIDDEDSPFPEVRASVSNIDDPDMPAMTIRMWFVGLVLVIASGALNVFLNFRSPAPSVVPLALLLISYPVGKFLAYILPITTYRLPLPNLPRRMFPTHQPTFAPFRLLVNLFLPLTYPRSLEFSLNPGPWNIKEHVLVYIMSNVAVGSPYALNAIVVSETFYGLKLGYWFSLTLVMATQLTGFGLAGMCRRFLVWPASMVWPQNLVACTLLNTLHAEDEDDGIGMYGGGGGVDGGRQPGQKGMTRYRFFVITATASFFLWILPGYLFEALSIFSFVCWAAPTNVPVNQLFGVRTGLGMSVLTFDWTEISWIGSPLMVPWWAEVHIFIGFVLFYWIAVPVLYYTNTWELAHFPIMANEPYDRFGNSYNVTRVLTTDDTFNATAYYSYSPLYLPAAYAMTYMLAFALSTCVIVHTLLYHGRTLLNGIKRIRIEADDIHAKLMRNYPEVPDWWYAVAFCVFFSIGIVAVEVWDTGVPIYALLLSVLLPVIYILPSGFIYAMTGQGISLNVIAQIIPGTLLPGKPFANMIFKAYSVQTLSAATSFVQDLKLGHYVKVPPRATFLAQMVATILAAFVQVGVKVWIFDNVEGICTPDQPSSLTCPHNQVFFTASAVWGLIGPTRQFGTGTLYHPHLYAIAVGAVLPIPFFFYQRRYPKSWVRYVSTPVVLAGVSYIPPATGINYSSWFAVGFIFQYLIRKRNFAWWSKFNYVLSSALDSGTVLSVMVVFFVLQFPSGIKPLVWWGNEVHTATADWNRTAFKAVPEGGLFWKDLVQTTTDAAVAAATGTGAP